MKVENSNLMTSLYTWHSNRILRCNVILFDWYIFEWWLWLVQEPLNCTFQCLCASSQDTIQYYVLHSSWMELLLLSPIPPPIPLYSSPGQIIVLWVTGLHYLLAVISLTQWPYYIPPGWGTWWLWWTIKMHQHGYLFYARWRLMRFLVLCIIVLVIILIRNKNGNSTIHWRLQWTRGTCKRPVQREVGSPCRVWVTWKSCVAWEEEDLGHLSRTWPFQWQSPWHEPFMAGFVYK